MAKNKYILGIDLGGTYIKYGLATKHGRLIKLEQVVTPSTQEKIINLFIKIIKSYQNKISKVGLGLPGRLDIKRGLILSNRDLPLSNTPIVKLIKQKIKLPIKIDNDARCFVLAESLVGAGKNYQTVVGLTLGTGVGGGIVINKKLYHGKGNAGELGHQFIDFQNKKDLEDYLGARRQKLTAKDYQNLANLAHQRDKKAVFFWKKIGQVLGFGIINIIHTLDPEVIILGGKLPKNYNLFYAEVKTLIKKYCLTNPPKIVKSKLIDKAGVIGATLLFK